MTAAGRFLPRAAPPPDRGLGRLLTAKLPAGTVIVCSFPSGVSIWPENKPNQFWESSDWDPWHFGADPDPDICSGSNSGYPFFGDLKDAKKKNHIFYNLPEGTLSSILKS
jgi:hypothetical protein